jgi:hypothetical protein
MKIESWRSHEWVRHGECVRHTERVRHIRQECTRHIGLEAQNG